MAFFYALLIGAASLFGSAAAVRAADLATYYHVGAWDAFSGRDGEGRLVCGIGNTNPANGRRFMLRFTIGDSAEVFTITKPTWAIPDHTQTLVVMQLGLEKPWTEQVMGNGQSLSWRMDRAQAQIFDAQFRRAVSMTLAYPDGNEPPMTVPLAGSTDASEAFNRCIRDFSAMNPAARASAAPQPSGPTQPFGAPPPTAPPPIAPPPTNPPPANQRPTQP